MRYVVIAFAMHCVRHWLLESIMLDWFQLSIDQFYSAYDAFTPLYLIIAFKCVSPKLNTEIKRITLDIMLAFIWADFIDRVMGVATIEPHDAMLFLFIILAVMKHTILKPYLK